MKIKRRHLTKELSWAILAAALLFAAVFAYSVSFHTPSASQIDTPVAISTSGNKADGELNKDLFLKSKILYAPHKEPAKPSPPPPSAPKPAPRKTSPTASTSSDIASESACPGQKKVYQAKTVLVCMTSYARHKHGASSVSGNSTLNAAATAKAKDLINCSFSHTACGHKFYYWIETKGYDGNCMGENLARGQTTPREVFKGWMNSSGHRANILKSSYEDIGIAAASSSNGIVWVMELGGC